MKTVGTFRTWVGLCGYLIWWIMMEVSVVPRICRAGRGVRRRLLAAALTAQLAQVVANRKWLMSTGNILLPDGFSKNKTLTTTLSICHFAKIFSFRKSYRQNGQGEEHTECDVIPQMEVVEDDGEAGLQQEVI